SIPSTSSAATGSSRGSPSSSTCAARASVTGTPSSRRTMDKRTTEAEAVAELRDGMTIGIGGWGSRRKPMTVVKEILRSPVKDLTIVSYGGPDVGMLCAAAKVKKVVY